MGVESVLRDIYALQKRSAAVDSAGATINPDAYPLSITYNGDGTVATLSFTDGVSVWTQTLTYVGGLLTGISQWVKS